MSKSGKDKDTGEERRADIVYTAPLAGRRQAQATRPTRWLTLVRESSQLPAAWRGWAGRDGAQPAKPMLCSA